MLEPIAETSSRVDTNFVAFAVCPLGQEQMVVHASHEVRALAALSTPFSPCHHELAASSMHNPHW